MSMKGLEIGSDVEVQNADSLGGTFDLRTGIYHMEIDTAFYKKANSGAMGLNLHLKEVNGNSLTRQTLWVQSGDKKGNKNYFVKDNRKILLPDMALANQIARIATGNDLAKLPDEKKFVKLYDFTAKAEKNTEVDAVTDLIGKKLCFGIVRCKRNKQAKQDDGSYKPTHVVQYINKIEKVFYADGFSLAEKDAEAEEAVFINTWKEKRPADYEDTSDYTDIPNPTADALEAGDTSAADDLFDD